MIPLNDNEDLSCYFVTKLSPWKGKYKRVFSIGSSGITTYNPSTLVVTNKWPYSDIVDVQCVRGNNTEFLLIFRKDKTIDKMKFSSENRSSLITAAHKFKNNFCLEKPREILRYQSYKHHWSDTKLPVLLEVTSCSLNQLDIATNVVLATYNFMDIQGFSEVKDYYGGFVIICAEFSRMHLFSCEQLQDIRVKMLEAAINIGIVITVLKEPVTIQEFNNQRFGKFSGDEHITSVSEFLVHKISHRHQDEQRRILCLSDTCLLERDPQTYNVCTLRPLGDVFAIVRNRENPQLFTVEYVNGDVRHYTAADRDSLLASLLDGVRASGNRDVHVKMTCTNRGKRFGPYILPLEQEVESIHLKYFQQRPNNSTFADVVSRFNCNVPYSGLIHSVTQDSIFAESKEKLINNALSALVQDYADQNNIPLHELEAQFHALRRLFASKIGFTAFTVQPGLRESIGKKVVSALRRNDDGVTQAAIDMICSLMHPMHDEYEIRQEQLNKTSLLSSKTFLENLLDMWAYHVQHGTAALVVSAMLDFLTFALCVPYSETTDGKEFDNLLEMVATRGRTLFKLFLHPSLAIVKGSGLVMRAIIEEGEPSVASKMQDLALSEGALPRHLLTALFTPASDGRLLANRQLSRHLIGLWVSSQSTSMLLLNRILPHGLLTYLTSEEKVPQSVIDEERMYTRDNLKLAQEHSEKNRKGLNWITVERHLKVVEKHVEHALQHWGAQMGFERRNKEKERKDKPVVLRRRRERIKSAFNWILFYHKFRLDHSLPHLIWNQKTRDELKDALEGEVRTFSSDRDLAGNALIAWNHQEFEVNYNCLSHEIKIGNYYLRLVLEDDSTDSYITRSFEFFNDLYHRFLLTPKPEMRCMCLQAMSIVYGRHYKEIGSFSDTKYIVGMLDRCVDKMERDRIIMFIEKLILDPHNVKDILDSNGVRVMVDMLTLAHLHTSRAIIPTQMNVIEEGPNKNRHGEKEWHYQDGSETKGPVSFQEIKELWTNNQLNQKTKCWSQGMDGWRTILNVPQLKWYLMAKGNAVLNESELAALILNILIKMCEYFPSRDADDAIIRPLPRVKKLLSDTTCLLHIVQVLLTFDPVLVEKVSTLLYLVMCDNPKMSTLYLTGVFYFILMYNGSNVLPIARFLKLTHMLQANRNEEVNAREIMQKSILGPLLPEAMLSYLENHGADKFAQIFLGEFDTPEAIWSREMRQLLIQKIAMHIAEFTPRLRSNTRAPYNYCAIPAIRYPQLENELFCSIYYLRHLCDTIRFPSWSIKDPVVLLKDVLETWKKEVEKKPPAMSVDDAYELLGLKRGQKHEESSVRKCYYRLAQQYHPDKNPEGTNMFQQVNQAYEFLCSRSSWSGDGPNPHNIVLVLKTQSILFERFSKELEPYKYAGYPQLIKTIQLETVDDALFSKKTPLLAAASELAYHTVHCSALNVEELRREKGLEILLDAYSRCVSVLSRSSKPTDTAVHVCTHVTNCYSVAGQFQACRDKMVEMPQLVKDVCRILLFKHLAKLCSAAAECVSSLAFDSLLQMQMLKAGVLWHLLIFMFKYDYTLEEGGVERNEEENQQEVSNKLAKLSVRACARLGGYLTGDLASPSNHLTRTTLEQLLTPYVARLLTNDKPTEVLKLLNSNSSNPYLLWDNSTRVELLDYLETQTENKLHLEGDDFNNVNEFAYAAHSTELKIGDVYIRVYNEQPTFTIQNPKAFTLDLLEFLRCRFDKLKEHSTALLLTENQDNIKEVVMALIALNNLFQNNPDVEIQCIGSFKLLFSMLSLENCQVIQKSVLQVLHTVTRNIECVGDIAATDVLGHLLVLLYNLPDEQLTILNTLFALMTTSRLVKEALSKGIVIYSLDLFCNSAVPAVREKCAELIARMITDKLIGPKVRLTVSKFLPSVFADAMRESPEVCVHMFEGAHENPELIWDVDSRKRVSQVVADLRQEHFNIQRRNPGAEWRMPDDNLLKELTGHSEMVVAGVYLRLFVAKPGWAIRKPKEFLNELIDTCLNLMSKDRPDVDSLELATNAFMCLLEAQPALAGQVPALGHIPRLLKVLTHLQLNSVPKSAIMMIHQLAKNDICVNAMSQTDCVLPIKRAMESRKDTIANACEALNCLFSCNSNQLVRQALDADLVPYLLSLLDSSLEVEHQSLTKAQIVKILKSMTNSPLYGDRINILLEKSSVWCQYRDQKHDLFITSNSTAGYLTGIPSTAGYLTQGPSKILPEAPPPVDKDD